MNDDDRDVGYTDASLLATQQVAGGYEPPREPLRWHGAADLGLLIIRLFLGGTFIAHGAQKLFGAFGGPGVDGFARGLEQMGFRQAGILSWVTGVTEFGGGLLLVLGLFTPLAAAGLVGVMSNAVFLEFGSGFFAMNGGFELPATLGAVALGLMFTGPGRAALDNGRAWFRRPGTMGFISLLIAAAASAGVLFLLH